MIRISASSEVNSAKTSLQRKYQGRRANPQPLDKATTEQSSNRVDTYLSERLGILPRLKIDESNELIHKAQAGDTKARNEIIEHNFGLIGNIAKRYRFFLETYMPDMTLNDLISDGIPFLIKAIQNYDFSYGIEFSTHATTYIKNGLKTRMRNLTSKRGIPFGKTSTKNKPTTLHFNDEGLNVSSIKDEQASTPDTEASIKEEEKISTVQRERILAAIAELLSTGAITERERDIFFKYYSINNEQKYTIRKLGDEYGLSRERCRQLKEEVRKKIISHLQKTSFEIELDEMLTLLTSTDEKVKEEKDKLLRNGFNYKQAVLIRHLRVETERLSYTPRGLFRAPQTAKNLILATLDTIPGFKDARDKSDIETMAELYRKHVINYKAKDPAKYRNGQQTFFEEIGGLTGLITTKINYLSKTGSAAALIKFALPQLIDPAIPGTLDPLEIERGYWKDPNNAKYHTLKALDTIPGFKEARERNDIKIMATLYRKYVINYKATDTDKYKENGQRTFFKEVGGLNSLISNKIAYLDKNGSTASLIRLVLDKLIDPTNPDALNPSEVERNCYKMPDNTKEPIALPPEYRISA